MLAAVGEAAAWRHLGQCRHLPRDGGQRRAAPRDIGQRGEQRLRVGMLRSREEGFAARDLDQFAGIHDADAVRHARDHAEIVRDQQDGHAARALQFRQQIEDLRLHGDVQGGGRLVGDQQFGFASKGDGDHHALLHAAGKLERVFTEAPLGVGDADLAQQFEHALAGRLAAQAEVSREHFADLVTDGHHRVEAGRRFLEDHRHPRAAQPTHLGFRQGQQFLAGEAHAAAADVPGRRQQAHDPLRGDRLAAARFAEQGKSLAGGNGKGNAVDRSEQRVAGGEAEAEVGHLQHAHAALGSNASRTASANRLAASTRMNIAANAAASDHQTTGSRPSSMRALLIIVPKLVIVGSTPMPT